MDLFIALVLTHFIPDRNQIMLQMPVRDRKIELADLSIFLTQYGVRGKKHTHTHPTVQPHIYMNIYTSPLDESLCHTQMLFYLSIDDAQHLWLIQIH